MSPPHLAKGAAKPEVNPDVLRIYSMKFCPYAERSRLVATFKNIPYEEVNLNLRDKPEWMFDLNPTGTVPILEYKDHVIYESAIIDEYLEEAFPASVESEALLPADPFKRAEIKLFMTTSDSLTKLLYQVLRGENREEALSKWFKGHQVFENQLAKTDGPFFGGAHINMLDLHIWPHFERVPAWGGAAGLDMAPKAETHPRLTAWIGAMKNSNSLKKVLQSDDLHKRFIDSMLAGDPQYELE